MESQKVVSFLTKSNGFSELVMDLLIVLFVKVNVLSDNSGYIAYFTYIRGASFF
ncbi:MAG: hypothetical protein ACLT5X_05340 [Blautia producta]